MILLVGLSLAIGECLVRKVPTPFKYKHEWMQQHASEVETLILGSSHAYFGISPSYMKHSGFNLANVSQNLKYDSFLLEQYASDCKNLKQVVLTISYFTLFSPGFEGTKNWWNGINYKVYMDCPYHSDFSKYNFELFHLPVYAGKLRSFFQSQSDILCDSLGWGKNYSLRNKPASWDRSLAEQAVRRHTKQNWDYLDENEQYLNKIAFYCQEHSLSLVLVTMPAWPTYYENLDKKQLNKMHECIQELQHEYGLVYYDYLKDSRFVEEDFYDSDHLSDVGARKFTEIFVEECSFRF